MTNGSIKKGFWNMFNIPYWHIRIVNDDYRILAEIYTKQTLAKKYIKHKASKTAYLLPDRLKQITKKSKTEVTYNYKDSKPLYPLSENDIEQKKILSDIRRDMANIRNIFTRKDIEPIPVEQLPINKFNDKPITYNNKVDPVWLYEALDSKFAKEILEIPKSGLEALMPLLMLGLIVVVIIAALFILGG